MSNEIQFGVMNITTGLFKDGYVSKNKEMKFKDIPWYKKLFTKEPTETVYLTDTTFSSRLVWESDWHSFSAPVYKKFNSFSGEIKEIYAVVRNHGKIQFSVDAYEQHGIFREKG